MAGLLLLAVERHVVGDTDIADMAAGTGGADRLQHRLLGADRLDDRVCAEAAGQLLDLRHALGAALGDDVGRAELHGQLLAGGVPAHGDAPPPVSASLDRGHPHRAELPRGRHAEQADRAVTDHGDRPAGTGLGGDGREPAGAEHVGGGQQARAKRFHHPAVGALTLAWHGSAVDDEPGLTLLIYTAEPGSPSEEALQLLASWTASQEGAAPADRLQRGS